MKTDIKQAWDWKQLFVSKKALIFWCFAAIYIIWGATYLASYWATRQFAPMLMGSVRFFIAGLLTFAFFRWIKKHKLPKGRALFNACWLGILFLGTGAGGAIWAVQFIDTGFTSMLVTIQPGMILLLLWIIGAQTPRWRNTIGIFLGIIGTIWMVQAQGVGVNKNAWLGILLISNSIISWTFASVFISRVKMPESKGVSVGIQMMAAGIFLMIISLIVNEPIPTSIKVDRAFWAFLFLLFFGSIVAYSAFNYLLLNVTADKVATVTYVNPIVAVILGFLLNDEKLGLSIVGASVIMLIGVYFVNSHTVVKKKGID